jgi:protocatechuate 3,4-dioxygenase beta subunit
MRGFGWLLVLVLLGVGLWSVFGTGDDDLQAPGGQPDDPAAAGGEGDEPTLTGSAPEGLLASGEEAGGTRIVHVRVVDPEGVPQPGVRVVLRKVRGRQQTKRHAEPVAYLEWRARWDPTQWETVDEATSDAEGRVRFEGLALRGSYGARAEPEPPFYPNQIWIGGVSRIAGFHVPRVGEREIVTGKGVPLRVRVVDGNDRGVPARLSFSAPIQTRTGEEYWQDQGLETDKAGRYTFASVPRGLLDATVSVPGRAGLGPFRIESPAKDEILLRLDSPDGAAIHGVVRDLTGAAVPGASLLLGMRSEQVEPEVHTQRMIRADDAGRYRFEGLPAGRIDGISAAAKDHLLRQNLGRGVALAPRGDLELEVLLPRASYITGTVKDEAGVPIAAVMVRVAPARRMGGNRTFELLPAFTDAQGRYRLTTVPPGAGSVIARKQGFSHLPDARSGALQYVIRAPGETAQVSIVLQRGAAVTGVVLGASGAPVTGAEVVAGVQRGADPWALGERVQATVDAAGAFTFPGLPRGKRYVLRARGPAGYSDPQELEIPKDGEVDELRLVLQPGAILAGRLLVAGGGAGRTANRVVSARIADTQFQAQASTDEDGHFRFEGLPAGTFQLLPPQTIFYVPALRREALSGEALPGAALEVTLAAGERREDLELTMPSTQEIEGRIIDESGAPYPRLMLRLAWSRGGHSGTHSLATNVRGRFTFPNLPEGSYTLSAGEEELGPVEAGQTGLEYTVARTSRTERARLEVRVRMPDGSPAPSGEGQLRSVDAGGGYSGAGFQIQDGRGTVHVQKPRKGARYVLIVSRVGDVFGRPVNVRPVEIDPVDVTQAFVEVQLEEGLTIAGQVVDQAGRPVPGLVVTLVRAGHTSHQNPRATTDAEGRFRIESLDDAQWNLVVQVGSSEFIPEVGTPVTAGDQDVRIEMQKGGHIKGEVYDPEGKPAPQAQITWQAEAVPGQQGGGRYANARTDADGRFTLRGLQPGLFGTLHVFPDSSKPTEAMRAMIERVRVGTADVRVDLDRGLFIEGTVVLPEGEALGPLSLFIQGKGANQQLGASTQVKEGAFKLGPVPAGEYLLRAMGGGLPQQDPIDVVAPSTDVVVRLQRGVPLAGKLLVDDPQDFIGQFIHYDADGNVTGNQGFGFSQDGAFRVALPEDAAGLLYVGSNKDDRMAVLKSVKPSDGPFEIRVIKGGAISGRVEGLPKNFSYGFVQTMGWLSRNAQIGKDGTFRIGALPPGKYDVMFWTTNLRGSKTQVPVGTTDLVLTADEPK